MKIIHKITEMQKITKKLHSANKTIGLVPTMGALHGGHISLIQRARKENDCVIVSIFVNPTQFGPNEDYLRYPRPFNKDVRMCKKYGVNYVFAPTPKEMYDINHLSYVTVEKLSNILCGEFRQGHFRGVTTVVTKLFNITQPDRAYFGEKDYQQLMIIQKMVNDLNFPVKIIPCPTIRENDGLALSSRNLCLSKNERIRAGKIYRILLRVKKLFHEKKLLSADKIVNYIKNEIRRVPGLRIQYVKICNSKTLDEIKGKLYSPARILIAVWDGKTRLIDNIEI